MDEADQLNQEREKLKRELNEETFFGPYISSDGRTGKATPSVDFTGLSIRVATASCKVDAPILWQDSWWRRPHDLVIERNKITFPFTYFGKDLVPLFWLLNSVALIRKQGLDTLEIIGSLEPALALMSAAPLKLNAAQCVASHYQKLGFACAPAKMQRSSVITRIVWLYPKERHGRSTTNYLPVGTLKFGLNTDYSLGEGVFDFPDWNQFIGRLGLLIKEEDRKNPWNFLSEIGRNEILTVIRSKKENGHPRTHKQREKLAFVKLKQELWDSPLELGRLLQEHGFYSRKIPKQQLLHQTESLVALAKQDPVETQ